MQILSVGFKILWILRIGAEHCVHLQGSLITDNNHDTDSDDDTPDVDRSDSTWAEPRHNGVANANSRAIAT